MANTIHIDVGANSVMLREIARKAKRSAAKSVVKSFWPVLDEDNRRRLLVWWRENWKAA